MLTKHQGQEVHGFMRYACAFFTGKYRRQVSSEVMALSPSTSCKSVKGVTSFCDYAIQMLQAACPRRLDSAIEKRPLLIFTDECWEPNFAGIGAILVDMATGQKLVCNGVVPDALIRKWNQLDGDHIIYQVELYVMVLIRWRFRSLLLNRKSIWLVDIGSTRYCAIKGLSQSPIMLFLVREFYELDSESPTYSWIERVPSSSNLPDGPSRHECTEALRILDIAHVTPFEHPDELAGRLL